MNEEIALGLEIKMDEKDEKWETEYLSEFQTVLAARVDEK